MSDERQTTDGGAMEEDIIAEDTTTIGIDLGTSHCTAAVWDARRGHPKWMRLSIAYPQERKEGRIVPSAILFLTREAADQLQLEASTIVDVSFVFPEHPTIVACVGSSAMKARRSKSTEALYFRQEIEGALLTSFKRILGLQEIDERVLALLAREVFLSVDHDELVVQVQPLGSQRSIHVTPSQATTILLQALRVDSENYLKVALRRKKLRIPGQSWACPNCVIGVPAHYGQAQRSLVTECARQAGFTGKVSVLAESTAAAMAYGMFVQQSVETTILVVDGGGGTTDVTIASLAAKPTAEDSQRFRVLCTEGDAGLGGDDMDAALLQGILRKAGKQVTTDRQHLLTECRRAKERLCGDVDHGYTQPEDWVAISIEGMEYKITQEDLEEALRPWLERARKLVRGAMERCARHASKQVSELKIDEVILVGGATRVPAVREMLRQVFPPPPDLCLSVNAMAAVAQGAAIQAAIQSGRVPLHEVRSAMMLDTVPHAIGILTPAGDFVEVIPRNASLPASGSAVFELADVYQPGISLAAVEEVDGGRIHPKVGDFSFLLVRLPKHKIASLQGRRSIEVRMVLRQGGEFLVSVYDENDPEHAKETREPLIVVNQSSESHALDFRKEDIKDVSGTVDQGFSEERLLLVACIVLGFVYVGAKIFFQDILSVYESPQ
jgi:molecular chaperone DnaK (HSP70)